MFCNGTDEKVLPFKLKMERTHIQRDVKKLYKITTLTKFNVVKRMF